MSESSSSAIKLGIGTGELQFGAYFSVALKKDAVDSIQYRAHLLILL